jgi:hypothetical protein
VKGIGPSYTDWKSVVLPLNYTRFIDLYKSILDTDTILTWPACGYEYSKN